MSTGAESSVRGAGSLRVAAISVNQTPLDFEGNTRRIIEALSSAREKGSRVVVLPELCVSGYGCQDYFFYPETYTRSLNALFEILPETEKLCAVIGTPLVLREKRYSAAALFVNGKLRGFFLKRNLANDGVHYEALWFTAWSGGIDSIKIDGEEIPVGDLVVDLGDGLRLGCEICEDGWVGAGRTSHHLSKLGVNLVVNPSASHFAFEKYAQRKALVLEGSRIVRGAYLYANLLGNESGRTIYDGDTLIANCGEFVNAGKRFTLGDSLVTISDLLVERTEDKATSSGELNFGVVKAPLVDLFSPNQLPPIRMTEPDSDCKEEEFSQAVTLGLLDYMRKSHSRGFSLSLSGGADSGALLLLCGAAIHRVFSELDGSIRDKNYPELTHLSNSADAIREMVFCIYQATENSGSVTETAARTLAERIGATFRSVNVQPVVDKYESLLEEVLGRPAEWSSDNIAKQNIQARVRMPLVWYIANIKNFLLLCTSNRSEGSVGYSTMDGDLAGSIAPLAGVSKHFLLQWLRWVKDGGMRTIFGDLPELSLITDQAPTAELKPPGEKQTDEGDLMPYEVLEQIERLFVKERKNEEEILNEVKKVFIPRFSESELSLFVDKFSALWKRSQWKRERTPVSFHLDSFSVDPKGWGRFPVLCK